MELPLLRYQHRVPTYLRNKTLTNYFYRSATSATNIAEFDYQENVSKISWFVVSLYATHGLYYSPADTRRFVDRSAVAAVSETAAGE